MSSTKSKPERVAIYTRVSSRKQAAEGLSLGEQRDSLRRYAESQGWEVADKFEDAGISGRKASRPGLDRMLGALDGLDRVLVVSLDRLGRDARGMLELFERFERAGVALVATRQSIDTSNAMGRMLPKLMAVLAEFEAEQLAERVAANAEQRARQGRGHGKPPYGYRSADGGWEIVPHEAATVRRIYDLAESGQAQRPIARALNAEGVPSPTGARWGQATIRTILANPAYRGAVILNDTEHEGEHEPIIGPEQWRRVATSRRTRGHGPGRTPKGPHLFTRGLLRCECGAALVPRTHENRRSAPRLTYRCGARLENPDACDMPLLDAAKIDAAAYAWAERVVVDHEATRKQLATALDREAKRAEAQIDHAEFVLTGLTHALTKAKRDYAEGALTARRYEELADEFEAEQEAARQKVEQLRAQHEAATADRDERTRQAGEVIAERLDALRQAISDKTGDSRDIPAARALLARLFERFEVHRPASRDDLPAEQRQAAEAVAEAVADDTLDTAEAGEYVIVPVPRDSTVEGFPEDWRPMLRREPLPLDDKDSGALTR